tara:strand:- start:593 stop:967 length:375 start_codon:yes stop_codon:yes gene_type:complete
MNDKIHILRFNDTLESLLLQISKFTGKKYYNKFKRVRKINSSLPIKLWIENGLEYREKIMNKDETYFLEKSISKSNNSFQKILEIKEIYKEIDDSSKKNLWLYLQALVILSEDYVKEKINELSL